MSAFATAAIPFRHSFSLLRQLELPRIVKQVIFILGNSWLITPLPFPAAQHFGDPPSELGLSIRYSQLQVTETPQPSVRAAPLPAVRRVGDASGSPSRGTVRVGR